ncbi:MAG TPA: YfhO family protein [Verrucomicrobiota bacterium]|nr:YfhO family protein [Verrucomicrobiota bacterium]HNU49852.1 YfhO family protein [Verrucomicrobiota bacterium]
MNRPREEASRELSPGLFAGALALLLLLGWGSVLWGGRVLYWRDFGSLAYPVAAWHRSSLWSGELPLWNPWSHCGVPFLAQWNTLVLYPGALLYVLGPVAEGLAVFCVLHIWLGGLGMYHLVRAWADGLGAQPHGCGLGPPLAGVAYAFGGGMMASHIYPNYLVALGWMPWVVWLAVRACSGKAGAWRMASLVGALQLLSGAPEIVLLTWVMVGVVGLSEGSASGLRSGGRVLLAGSVAAGLVAAQLLPFLALAIHSHRGPGYSSADWGLPPWGTVNLVLPLFHCTPGPDGIPMPPGQSFLMSWHVSGAVVALAVSALAARRSRRLAWVVFGLVAGSLFLASDCSGPVRRGLAGVLPGEGLFRYPIKWVYLAVIGFPLLAGLGARAIEAGIEKGDRGPWRWCWGAAVGVVILMVAAGSSEGAGAAARARLWEEVVALGVVMGCLALALAWPRRFPAAGRIVVMAALGVALWRGASFWVPSVSGDAVKGTLGAAVPRPGLGQGRVMISPAAEAVLQRRAVPDPLLDVMGARLALWSNWNLVEQVAKVNGAMTLRSRGQAKIEHRLYSNPTNRALPLLRFLGVRHVSHPENPTEWAPLEGGMPWVTGGQTALFAPESEAIEAVCEPGFQPETTVYLPLEAAMDRAESPGRVMVTDVVARPHEVSFEVKAEGAGWVVVAQTWHPGWKARVDGSPSRVWKANGAFQAVAVPRGVHKVELRYREDAFLAGCAISLLSLMACAAAWVRRGFRALRKGGKPALPRSIQGLRAGAGPPADGVG